MNRPQTRYPSIFSRIFSVWARHFRVYSKNFLANGLPPFLEPLIFLAGIGFGLGVFVKEMDGVPYVQFLASGLFMSTAMMTSAFECSYGTFIRLEFDKIYDGMLAAPLSVTDVLLGEILWAGTKGFIFSGAVVLVIVAVGIFRTPLLLAVPVFGFLMGCLSGALSLFITSFVHTLDNFSFYFSGFLSPMFFFSGVVFPVSSLPQGIRWIAECLPLTHTIRLTRAVLFQRIDAMLIVSGIYIVLGILIFTMLGIARLKKRMVD